MEDLKITYASDIFGNRVDISKFNNFLPHYNKTIQKRKKLISKKIEELNDFIDGDDKKIITALDWCNINADLSSAIGWKKFLEIFLKNEYELYGLTNNDFKRLLNGKYYEIGKIKSVPKRFMKKFDKYTSVEFLDDVEKAVKQRYYNNKPTAEEIIKNKKHILFNVCHYLEQCEKILKNSEDREQIIKTIEILKNYQEENVGEVNYRCD